MRLSMHIGVLCTRCLSVRSAYVNSTLMIFMRSSSATVGKHVPFVRTFSSRPSIVTSKTNVSLACSQAGGIYNTVINSVRSYTSSVDESPSASEERLVQILRKKLPKASIVEVHDISGGCGSMYEVYVVAEEFRGVRTVAQHRMVTEALKTEIKNMHGLTIRTAVTQ